MKSKLLILDDDEAILQLLAAVFEDRDMEIILESDSDAAIDESKVRASERGHP